jgi:geranylgeranyl diphosphate synthase, type I
LEISMEEFLTELKDREILVANVFHQERLQQKFRPEVLRQAVYLYLDRPAKRLRPGILFFCCGAVGGAEEQAVLAAAAVELYHTWTLVHDDIIDNDLKRRGLATVHEEFRIRALDWGYPEREAADLGRSIAIITGDLQQAWSIRLLLDSMELGVPATVVFDLAERLTTEVTCGLLEGETLDVLFSKYPISDLAEQDVLNMLELKTGILYEFAAIAGASIGLAQTAKQNRLIQAVGRFARRCGLAFQLQDDILGVTGDQKLLGKPVGSDIREGKRTTIVLHAFHNAGAKERQFLREKLGNPSITEKDIAEIQNILIQYNGVEYTRKLAESFVSEAIQELSVLPESRFKDLLLTWARYIVSREL